MVSTDYPGQEFNTVAFNSNLDDTESGQLLFSSISFTSSLDDTESGQLLFSNINFTSSLDDSESGTFHSAVDHQSDYMATGGGASVITYYAMRAVDPDCMPLTYVSWVVTGTPDTSGAQYAGPRCGGSPLQDITIAAKWQE